MADRGNLKGVYDLRATTDKIILLVSVVVLDYHSLIVIKEDL